MADDPDTDEDLGIASNLPALALTPDQALRAFILKHYCSSGEPSAVDGRIFTENCESLFMWLKDGKVPAKPHGRGKLKVVEP